MPAEFRLRTSFEPKGDQPRAIEQLTQGLAAKEKHQVLLGITGSGKTFTIANVIQQSQQADAHPRAEQDARRAALRRDAGALPEERGRVLRQLLRLLPARGVRPVERHVHRQGRHHQRRRSTACATRRRTRSSRGATSSSSRRVSCIYGIGSAESYHGLLIDLKVGEEFRRDKLLRHAGRHPVRAKRRRLPPRHVPRARRRGRGLPRLRARDAPSASSSSATRSRRSRRSTRCAAG